MSFFSVRQRLRHSPKRGHCAGFFSSWSSTASPESKSKIKSKGVLRVLLNFVAFVWLRLSLE